METIISPKKTIYRNFALVFFVGVAIAVAPDAFDLLGNRDGLRTFKLLATELRTCFPVNLEANITVGVSVMVTTILLWMVVGFSLRRQ